MTTTDKTRLQLVDSIRKARTGAGAPATPTPPATDAPTAAPPRPRPAAARKAAKPMPVVALDPAVPGDPFRWGRRVWPD